MPVPADAVTSTTLSSSRPWAFGYGGAALISGVPSRWLRFAGQAQGALADDVALDLVGAAVDRVGAREQEQRLFARELVRRRVRQQGRHTPDVHGELAECLVPVRPRQLGDRRFGTGRTVAHVGERAQRVEPQQL